MEKLIEKIKTELHSGNVFGVILHNIEALIDTQEIDKADEIQRFTEAKEYYEDVCVWWFVEEGTCYINSFDSYVNGSGEGTIVVNIYPKRNPTEMGRTHYFNPTEFAEICKLYDEHLIKKEKDNG